MMRRNALIVLVVFLGVGGLIFAATYPEPTPEERLDRAAKLAVDSVREASEAVSDSVTAATESLAGEVERVASELSDGVAKEAALMEAEIASFSEQAKDQLRAFLAEWKVAGIIADKGIDYDKAIRAVDASSLSAEAKLQVKRILTALRDAPGAFPDKLATLESDLAE